MSRCGITNYVRRPPRPKLPAFIADNPRFLLATLSPHCLATRLSFFLLVVSSVPTIVVSMLASRAAARSCCRSARAPARAAVAARRYHGLAQSKLFKVSEEVRDAVATGKPVVALESTIYTHGMVSTCLVGWV